MGVKMITFKDLSSWLKALVIFGYICAGYSILALMLIDEEFDLPFNEEYPNIIKDIKKSELSALVAETEEA